MRLGIGMLVAAALLMTGCGGGASAASPSSTSPSPGPTSTAVGWSGPSKQFRSPQLGIAFSYPADWKLKAADAAASFATYGTAVLGVETAGGVFTKIIDKNTTIPCRKAQVFSTAVDNQPIVNVHVLQGEREMASDNKTLARFELVGIPPAPRGVPQIEVAFDIDANGIVHVSAKDLGTGKQQSIRIVASSGLTEQEIQRMVAEADQHKGSDKKKKELADLKNNAEGLIYTTEKALEEYATLLPPKDMAEIKSDLEALQAVVGSEDLPKIKAAVQRLEGSAYRIADALYSQGDKDKK